MNVLAHGLLARALAGMMLLTCAASVRGAMGQTLRGQVLNAGTGRPVPDVAVVLLNRDNRSLLRVLTDADGRYVAQAPEPGSYRLRFEIPGYRMTITELIALKRGETREFPAQLAPANAIALDTVVVAGQTVPAHLLDFYIRKSRGLGTFITPADLERLHPGEPSDVVRRLEGFDVAYDESDPSRKLIKNRRFGGGRGRTCPPVIFVDGVYVGNSDSYDINSALWVDRLDAVESYPSAARIPVEFNTTGTQCGVIAFWTKRQ